MNASTQTTDNPTRHGREHHFARLPGAAQEGDRQNLTHLVIAPVTAADLGAICALHEVAFGPGRFAKTAYRLREGTPSISPYCRLAKLDGAVCAAVRITAIAGLIAAPLMADRVAKDDHRPDDDQRPVLLLGPIAVAPTHTRRGIGEALLSATLKDIHHTTAGRYHAVFLVGDEGYYGRFGFKQCPPGMITLPGPVDPARLLIYPLAGSTAMSA